jgi:hypothetical protein
MKTAYQEGTTSHSEDQKLDLLVSRFLRILRACGVKQEEVTASLERVLAVKSEVGPVTAINAPAELHLACTDLVFNWRRRPPFLDSQGRPKKLRVHGGEDSFDALVAHNVPQIDSSLALSYLEQLGIVLEDAQGFVTLSADSVLACSAGDLKTVSRSTVLTHLQAFLSSVEYNLVDRYGLKPPRFERACYGKIPSRLVPILERLIDVRGQNFIDSIDEWLARHSSNEGEDGKTVWLAGAGAYVFAHPSNLFEEIESSSAEFESTLK